jgi:hypothetical protein
VGKFAASATPRITFPTPKTRFLTLTEKRLPAHHRLARMSDRPLRDIVVVIRNTHHQTRALTKETGGLLQFTDHDNARFDTLESAMKSQACIGNVSASGTFVSSCISPTATFWRMTGWPSIERQRATVC